MERIWEIFSRGASPLEEVVDQVEGVLSLLSLWEGSEGWALTLDHLKQALPIGEQYRESAELRGVADIVGERQII